MRTSKVGKHTKNIFFFLDLTILRRKLHSSFRNQTSADEFHKQLQDHINIQKRERAALAFKVDLAKNNKKDVLMIISDSPSKIYLPHFPLGNIPKNCPTIPFCWTGYVNPAWINAEDKIRFEPSKKKMSI